MKIYITREKPCGSDYVEVDETLIDRFINKYSSLLKLIGKVPGIKKAASDDEFSGFINDLRKFLNR